MFEESEIENENLKNSCKYKNKAIQNANQIYKIKTHVVNTSTYVHKVCFVPRVGSSLQNQLDTFLFLTHSINGFSQKSRSNITQRFPGVFNFTSCNGSTKKQ